MDTTPTGMRPTLPAIILSIATITLAGRAHCQSPTFGWARSLGTIGGIQKTLSAPGGQLVTIGMFSGTRDLDLGPDVMEVIGGTGNSTFITSMNADGTLAWARALTSTNEINSYDMAIGPDGSIVVTGSFRGTADLNAAPDATAEVSAGNDLDIHICKYSAAGVFQWGSRLGNGYDDTSTQIALDASGNIYHAMQVRGVFDMDPGPATVNVDAGSTLLGTVTKYAPDGTYLWHKAMGAPCRTITVQANGSIVTSHAFTDSATIGQAPNTIAVSAPESGSAFAFVRSNAQCEPQHALVLQGPYNYRAHVSPAGDLTIAGSYFTSIDLDPGTGTNIHTANEAANAFALRLNAQWEAEWGVSWDDDFAASLDGMDVDGYGNVYLTAHLYAPFDVDPGPAAVNLDPVNGTNSLLLMLNTEDGSLGFATRLMGSDLGYLRSNGVHLSPDGTIVTRGTFRATAQMDPWTNAISLTTQSDPGEESYLCAFRQEISSSTSAIVADIRPMLYPVPCTERLHVGDIERPTRYRIMDTAGRIWQAGLLTIGTTPLEVNTLPTGAYLLRLNDDQATHIRRFMKL